MCSGPRYPCDALTARAPAAPAVIRYDLEFLGLCPCMVDVEIIDSKAGNQSVIVSAGPDACTCPHKVCESVRACVCALVQGASAEERTIRCALQLLWGGVTSGFWHCMRLFLCVRVQVTCGMQARMRHAPGRHCACLSCRC